MSAVLELQELSVSYGSTQALRAATLDVRPGEIVAILGANGAGKSTIAKAVSGLARPQAGTVRFEGRSVRGVPASRRPQLGISCVPEGRGVLSDLSVLENLRLGERIGRRRDTDVAATSIDDVLHEYPKLRARLGQAAGTLSGGEQQMLVLGRALLARPRLLVLDEPSLGLAPLVVSDMYERIRTYPQRGMAILLIEQTVRKCLEVASRAYVLANGAVTISGTAAEITRNPAVQESYLGRITTA